MNGPVAQLLDDFTSGGWEYFQSLPGQRFEEHFHLDFKLLAGIPGDLRKDDKRNLSIGLSGFGNSDGGLLVWGVDAKPDSEGIDRVVGVKPIPHIKRFLSELKSLTPRYVAPPMERVQQVGVTNPDDPDHGYVITAVPRSEATPHMATGPGLSRYYRRAGTEFLMMHHVEVADMFGRRPQPRIELEIGKRVGVVATAGGRIAEGLISLKWVLKNTGTGIARLPCLSLGHPIGWATRIFDPMSTSLPSVPAPSIWWHRWAASADTVIYPEDEIDVANVGFPIDPSQTEFPDLSVRYRAVAEGCGPIDGVFQMAGSEIEKEWHKVMAAYTPDS